MESSVGTAVSTFERLSLVALGERHWAREDAQFRLKLIEHPAFTQLVDDIVLEFENPLHQVLLDLFVMGSCTDG